MWRSQAFGAAFSLSSLEGGSKDNAIPRSCTADLLFFGQFDNRIISNTVEKFTEQIQNEYQFTDPDIEVRSGWTDMTAKDAQVATAHDTRKTVAILTALPNGLMETDPNTGRPQTSLNLGICQMKDDQVQITYLVRSSINSQKKYLCSKVKAIGELAGARIDTTGDYPAWEYQKDCPLRDTLVEVYKKAYGKEPKISITHGGLECGLLAAKIPGLQSVSLGPDMEGIHTPDEKLSVDGRYHKRLAPRSGGGVQKTLLSGTVHVREEGVREPRGLPALRGHLCGAGPDPAPQGQGRNPGTGPLP